MSAIGSAVSVVVVSYNTRELLRRCLATVGAHPTVVVDNASSDGSAALVRDAFPGARLLALDRNVGFGAGANAGFAHTSTPYVLLLNPDAWPLGSALERLVAFADGDPRLALVGPQLVDASGRPQRSVIVQPLGRASLAAAVGIPVWLTRGYSAWRTVRRRRPGPVREDEFLLGAALLVRKEAFDDVGGFDESFFMFDEEVDLSFRLRRRGWRIDLCADAVFAHVGGAATEAVAQQMYRERLRSHLRLVAKQRGIDQAERVRRLLVRVLRLRARLTRVPRERGAAEWLAGRTVDELLGGGA